MKRIAGVPLASWLALLSAATFAATAFTVPHVRPVGRNENPVMSALRAEHASLAENDDATLEELRKRAANLPQRGWSNKALEAQLSKIPNEWIVERKSSEAFVDVSVQVPDPNATTWPTFLRTVSDFSRLSGTALTRVRCTSKANEIKALQFTARFALAEPDQSQTPNKP